MDYAIHIATMICIYSILAQGLNLCFGLGGLFNLAHAAVYSVGAYTAALLTVGTSASPIEVILASILLGALFSLILGGIALRLADDYFAIGTLAFSFVVNSVLVNWRTVTRGVLGIPGIPRPTILGIDLSGNLSFLSFCIFWLITCNALLFILFRGRLSRGLRAQSEFEHAALALGRNTTLIRNISFFIASCFAGLAGALYAFFISYIDPNSFNFHQMVFVLTIVIVGKPGSLRGPFFATVFLLLLAESMRFIPMSPGWIGPLRQILYASILFLAVALNRSNLFPIQRSI
ncbi:MAG: branched-chain amino acid ABC transporter permease [Bdellovibrionales bacterium]|nr:branched-chain amino acid ABC transporter permease [Bdellovibrionales bacterium]